MKSIKKQQGVVVFIALIVLVAMTLAGVALMRSVDTSTVVAGNLAFKQSTVLAADAGVEAAFNALPNIVTTSLDNDIPNQYFATRQPEDLDGVPNAIDWTTVPCADPGTGAVVSCTDQSLYRVQYIIDRQCAGPAPIADLETACVTDRLKDPGGSNKLGNASFTSPLTVFYRITVRVQGPRNTQNTILSLIGRT